MKRCPECRRDYYDDTLLYCLEDGNALLEGPAAAEQDPVTLPMWLADGSAPGEAPTRSMLNAVAVLPFANLSSNEDAEYLSDGLAEELLTVLSRIKGLRVVARTSAFSFKGKKVGLEEIGRSLRVGTVLEGSVRTAGKRVRIAVHLVDVEQGYQLWSEAYDRTMDDIFAIQDEIAQSVVEQLRSKLVGREPSGVPSREIAKEVARAVKGRSTDPQAHGLMFI